MTDLEIHDIPAVINSKKVRQVLKYFAVSSMVLMSLVSLVFVAYFMTFHGSISLKQETWGQFGDFVGGTLNPLFSFFSFLALVFTVWLQIHQLDIARTELKNSQSELKATREELKRSADAQYLTATALEEQAKHAVISAKLAALSSALSVTTETLAQARTESAFIGNGAAQNLLQRKEAITAEILNITEQLCGNQE